METSLGSSLKQLYSYRYTNPLGNFYMYMGSRINPWALADVWSVNPRTLAAWAIYVRHWEWQF